MACHIPFMLRYIEGYKNSKKDNREVVDPVTTHQACFQACFKVPMEPLSVRSVKVVLVQAAMKWGSWKA